MSFAGRVLSSGKGAPFVILAARPSLIALRQFACSGWVLPGGRRAMAAGSAADPARGRGRSPDSRGNLPNRTVPVAARGRVAREIAFLDRSGAARPKCDPRYSQAHACEIESAHHIGGNKDIDHRFLRRL